MKRNAKDMTKWLCICGLLMAMNVALSSFRRARAGRPPVFE